MSLQIAKNVYNAGIHCPTWSLRADDPSRRKQVRLPRAAIPAWFWALKGGRLSEAQDELDAVSGMPRSWARWWLLGQMCLFAVAAGSSSLSEGTTAAQRASRQAGSGERKG